MLTHTPERYRLGVLLALFTGLRLGELLGLRWCDLDVAERVVRVTGQIDATGQRVELAKTSAGHREIVLTDALATIFKTAKLGSRWSADDDPVIASETGTPMKRP